MTFADIEARATAAIFRRVVNAQASFTHAGVPTPVVCDVVFDSARTVVDEALGVVTNRPEVTMTPDAAPLTAEGDTVVLTHTVSDTVVPLGTFKVRSVLPVAEGGMQHVALAKA